MIISASRRCDIPNYQSDWFFDALKKGEIVIPKNLLLGQKISLKKEDVDCIVFWTKNPKPMLHRLPELEGYHYYFQFTLTGYSKKIEPGVPNKQEMIEIFKNLSVMTSTPQVIWRYDPIFLSPEYPISYHKKAFAQISQELEGYTNRCVISFIDMYGKIKERMQAMKIREPSLEEIYELAGFMAETAEKHGIVIETCAEKIDLLQYGIMPTHCIDSVLIKELTGKEVRQMKDAPLRPNCGCCSSIDIGTYHRCKNQCMYCYAN